MNRLRAWGMSLLFLSGTISPILLPQARAQSGSWQMQQMRQQQAMQRQQQMQQQQAMQQRQQQMQQQQAALRQQQAMQQRMQQRVIQRPPQVLPRNAVTMPRTNAAAYPRYAPPPVSASPSRSIPTTAIRGQPNRNVGASEGRGFVSTAGIAKLTRPLTPGEIKKGFTGKVSGDGRPLIKFQGRVFAVPAASISGLVKKPSAQSQMVANTNRWSARQKVAMNARLNSIISGNTTIITGSRGSTGSGGPPNITTPSNQNNFDRTGTARQRLHFRSAVLKAKSYTGNKLMLGRNPSYIHGAMRAGANYFQIPADQWDARERELKSEGLDKRQIEVEMFDRYNRKTIDRAIARNDKIYLSSPKSDAESSVYYKMEIDYLEKNGYKLSEDGLEMIAP